jgi:acyl dehydratase
MRTFRTIGEIDAAVGDDLGTTSWFRVEQQLVTDFARLTRDENWIHVDVERAKVGPFAGTIAHGYLTLSLLPYFANQLIDLAIPHTRLNYGLNKVRFPHPVRVGQRVRGTGVLMGLPKIASGHQLIVDYRIDVEGADKPACVAESVLVLLGPD